MNLTKRFAAAFLSGCMVLSAFTCNYNYTDAASNSSLMTKYLKYFKQGDYKKASSYLKKMKKSDKDTSLKSMSGKMKSAYLKTVKKYDNSDDSANGGDYLWGYYLADLNKDKQAELLIQYGSCEADVQTFVYTYTKGKAKRVTKYGSSHSALSPYEGKGILLASGHMGVVSVSVLSLKGSKLQTKDYGTQDINDDPDASYCIPSNVLNNHIEYDKDYNRSVDYSDLE